MLSRFCLYFVKYRLCKTVKIKRDMICHEDRHIKKSQLIPTVQNKENQTRHDDKKIYQHLSKCFVKKIKSHNFVIINLVTLKHFSSSKKSKYLIKRTSRVTTIISCKSHEKIP